MGLSYLQRHHSIQTRAYTLVQFTQCPAFVSACVGVCHVWRSGSSFACDVCPLPVPGKDGDLICAPAPAGTVASFAHMIDDLCEPNNYSAHWCHQTPAASFQPPAS